MDENGYGFTCTDYEVISEDGSSKNKIINMPKVINYRLYLKNTIIQTVGVMIDTAIIKSDLLKMPMIRRRQDAATWCNILKNGFDCYGLNENLCSYRRVGNSLSSNKFKAVKGTWDLYRKIERLSLKESIFNFIGYAWNACKKRIYIKKSIKINDPKIEVAVSTMNLNDPIEFVKNMNIQTDAIIINQCMENTYRDVNIALANELAKIGSKLGINILDVIKIANKHPRVNILSPGPGVGGHCLAIDPYFIYSLIPETAKIIKLARDTNRSMPDFVVENVRKIIKNEDNPIISVLGVAYKGNSDDDRESPSYEIINNLKEDYTLKIYDPHIEKIDLSFDEAIKDSSLILVLTNHDEFMHMDFDKIKQEMEKPVIFDTRNIIDKHSIPDDIILYNFGNLYDVE